MQPLTRRAPLLWVSLGLLAGFVLGQGLRMAEGKQGAGRDDLAESLIDLLPNETLWLPEDGAQGESGFIVMTEKDLERLPYMKRILALGPRAVPALIDHVDDVRPTGIKGRRRGTRRVGAVCLQLLWGIAVVKEVPGAGGEDLWFEPQDSPWKMKRAKMAWLRKYNQKGSLLRTRNILKIEGNPWF